ncbi:hypothetical protein EB810_00970 [Altererythrobacter sp. FM1]|uniref:Uncharacterized protein n=1 Tax=Tsuneonella flava TaxID=2055955 RepID=A0ABX7KCE5_9SPHN|nr:hypothetical protein IDJ81_01305 [Tsuneonella flava]ROT97465.1 hypothetical protein EB810_00970 [Altererythrobacter sp. FM1]
MAQAPSHTSDTAPQVKLSLQQNAAVRCSAAFALGAGLQKVGKGKDWPPLAERGREFFVRASAQLMDETGMSRDAVGNLVQRKASELAEGDKLDRTMPACLLMLDSSGL